MINNLRKNLPCLLKRVEYAANATTRILSRIRLPLAVQLLEQIENCYQYHLPTDT